jgi:hypothetical protein
MANTLELGNGKWATGKDTVLAFNDQNNNFKPLPFSFSRDTSGTVVNKEGLIETVGSGEPRIDFKDNTKGALLLEPSRTNLVTNSELLNTWFTTKSSGAVITDNYGIAPNGLQNSSRIQLASSDYCLRGLSLSTNSTSSVYVKGIIGETIQFGVGANVAQGGIFTFNGFWQRIEYTYQNGSGSILFSNLQGSATATDFEAFGLQVEDNVTYATSYIPTSGSAVTRIADVCNNGGNDQVINSTEGVLYAEIKGFISSDTIDPNRYITLTNGTSNERVALLLGGNNNQLRAIIYSSTQSVNLSFTTSLTDVKKYNKLAVKYKSGDYAFFLNGPKIGGSTEASIFSQNTLNDFSFDVGGGTQQFRGVVKDAKLYNTALTDQELIALTTI